MKIFTPKFIWMIWIPIWIQLFSYKILLCTPRFYKLKFIEKKLYTKNLYTEILYTNFTCLSWISIWIQFFHTKYCFIRVSTYKVLCVQSFHVYISMYKVYILKYVFLFFCFFFWKVLHMERGHHDRTWAIAHYRLIFHMVVYSLGEK